MDPILIVDDNEDVRFVLESMLSLQFPVITAAAGFEALEIFQRSPISLTITDLRMPVVTGGELMRQIRRLRPDHPVIVITGHLEGLTPDEEDVQKNANAILRKPFHVAELFPLISRLLQRAPDESKCEIPVYSAQPSGRVELPPPAESPVAESRAEGPVAPRREEPLPPSLLDRLKSLLGMSGPSDP